MQVEAEWSKARKDNSSGKVLVQTNNVKKPAEEKEKAEMQKLIDQKNDVIKSLKENIFESKKEIKKLEKINKQLASTNEEQPAPVETASLPVK